MDPQMAGTYYTMSMYTCIIYFWRLHTEYIETTDDDTQSDQGQQTINGTVHVHIGKEIHNLV